MDIIFHTIEPSDNEFLREMLYQAIFVPPGVRPYERSILELPEISRYVENWGRENDFGIIVCVSGEPAGAVWCRLFPESQKGFGYLDHTTPELSIAVREEYRGMGIGKILMEELFQLAIEKGFEKISLSVDRENPAFRLYKRLGFIVAGGTRESPVMVKKFPEYQI